MAWDPGHSHGLLAPSGECLVQLHHAHFLNTDFGDVQTPAPRPHFGVVMNLHPDHHGFFVFIQEESDFLKLHQARLGVLGSGIGGFLGHGVFPANIS